MRDGFKSAILERAKVDDAFHVLTGDHGYALFDEFALRYPDRFHNVGVAETNMIGLAAGMARNGMRPLVYGLAAFVPNRVFEFIKLQIATDGLSVTMVGDGAGLVYSTLGVSHQTIEDLAIIGSLPSVTALAPASNEEMQVAVEWAGHSGLPVYIRMGKSGGSFVGAHPGRSPHPTLVREASFGPTKRALIAHGSMVSAALELSNGPGQLFDIWSCPTIFPLPESFLEELSFRYEQLVVLEEHGTHGGLGSNLLFELSKENISVEQIGAKLEEERTTGSYPWALRIHGLSDDRILQKLGSLGFLH